MDQTQTETFFTDHAGVPVGFVYDSPERGRERRQIIPDADEPIRVAAGGRRLVIGEDLARGGPRSFGLDRVVSF